MFFSKLTELKDNKLHATKEMVNFMKKAFDIEITEEAICEFEYKQTADVDYPISSKQCKLQIVTTSGNIIFRRRFKIQIIFEAPPKLFL